MVVHEDEVYKLRGVESGTVEAEGTRGTQRETRLLLCVVGMFCSEFKVHRPHEKIDVYHATT